MDVVGEFTRGLDESPWCSAGVGRTVESRPADGLGARAIDGSFLNDIWPRQNAFIFQNQGMSFVFSNFMTSHREHPERLVTAGPYGERTPEPHQ